MKRSAFLLALLVGLGSPFLFLLAQAGEIRKVCTVKTDRVIPILNSSGKVIAKTGRREQQCGTIFWTGRTEQITLGNVTGYFYEVKLDSGLTGYVRVTNLVNNR